MQSSALSQWFVEIDGKKTGPFTTVEIENYYKANKIHAQHRITAEHLKGQWITVQQLIQSIHSGQGGQFHPPPRPKSSLQPTTGTGAPDHEPALKSQPDKSVAVDPAMSLFDALQAAKEGKIKAERKGGDLSPTKRAPGIEVPPILLISLAFIVLFGGLFWLFNRILQKSSLEPTQVAQQVEAGHPVVAPPKPIAQPTKPATVSPPHGTLGTLGTSKIKALQEARERQNREREAREREAREREAREREAREREIREKEEKERDRERDQQDAVPQPEKTESTDNTQPQGSKSGPAGDDLIINNPDGNPQQPQQQPANPPITE